MKWTWASWTSKWTSKWIWLAMAGLGIAGFAGAQEQDTGDFEPDESIESEPSESESYQPSQDIVTDESHKPSMSMGESTRDSPTITEYGLEETAASKGDEALTRNRGQSRAKAEDLEGKTVVTLSGDEVGRIGRVGKSPEFEERVATIDVGEFLGVGEKTIAVPLSKLHRSEADGDRVRISIMRTAIEAQPEFDESTLQPEQ